MKRDIYDGFGQVVGKREDIEGIAKIVFKEDAQKVISNLPEGKYVSLGFENWEKINAEELMEKYPACELFIYDGESNYLVSAAGETNIIVNEFYVHSNGDVEYYRDEWAERIFYPKITSSISIKLTDGRELRYEPSAKSIKKINYLASQPLTIGLLSDICNPYTMPKKRKEFIEDIRSKVGAIDSVSSITVSISTTSSFAESDIAKLRNTELAEQLSDITVLRFFNSSLYESETKVFDYLSNTLTTEKKSTISVMDDPAAEKYELINIENKNPTKKIEQIVGLAAAEHVDILFEPSGETGCTCKKCLSDFETIRVPDEIDGLKVTKIGDGCFEKLVNVKKVILPCTVNSIGKGAFAGCNKLASVVYADNPDTKDDFIICDKEKLVTLITNKSSYVIPDTVKEIEKNAFSNCVKLKSVILRPGMKRLLNDSLAECKPLKTIDLSNNPDDINITALEKGGIKEVILPTGKSVEIYDKYMFGCFSYTPDGMTFSYQNVAEKFSLARSEIVKFKIAIDLVENHIQEINEDAILPVIEFAVKYTIGSGDAEELSRLLELEISSKLHYSDLVNQANRCGNSEIVAMVLAKSGQSVDNKKTVIRHETPAEALSGWDKLYIKVRFENNKAYSYFCNFKVNKGDKVFVPGKMAGMPGEVIEIMKDSPSGRAAMYTLEVTEAFNVRLEEVDDNLDL